MTAGRIDFASINAAALPHLEKLCAELLPGGEQRGREYVAGDLQGGLGESLSVNLLTGVWADFATNEGGSDPVSLVAATRGVSQGEAARELAARFGGGHETPARAAVGSGGLLGKPTDPWRPLPEIPDHAPPPPDQFSRKEKGSWIRFVFAGRWTYRDAEGRALFHVCRFERPGGGKEIVPQTFCNSIENDSEAWRWKAHPEPRPLYGLDRLAVAAPESDVVLVEGEKTADAAQRLLPGAVCMTWPGGAKAVRKVDFKPLVGRKVTIWPDADAPGRKAAVEIAARLKTVGAAEVRVVTPPDGVTEGWDLADAEAEGWDGARAIEHIQNNMADPFARAGLGADGESGPQDVQGLVMVRDGELAPLVDACEAILVRPDLPTEYRPFQRGGQLVRVAVLPTADFSEGVARPLGAAVIMPIGQAFLVETLSRFGQFTKWDGRSQSLKPVDPPKAAAESILARSGLWRFPVLRGLVACPTIRADGSLLAEPGYDGQSGYFLAHGLKIEVPGKPTQDLAGKALQFLRELLAGFTFIDEVDRAVAMALIVTAVVRPAMNSTPVFAVTAPVRGSGKSTLMDLAAIIATGRRSVVLSATADPVELEKRLAGCLLSGDAIINLDNLNGTLSSDLLCQATTCESVKLRPLGGSAQVEISNTALWSANGNNLTLAGDLSRRALMCRLDPGVERPEERTFAFDPVRQAMERRADYLGAILAVVRGYVEAGRPDMLLTPFGSFERWSGLVRSALVWAGAEDPCQSRESVLADDPEAGQLRTLLTAWHERFGRTPMTVREVVKAAGEDDSPLSEILDDIAGERGSINCKRLGRWLRRQAGRLAGGLKLTRYGKTDVANWKVLPENEG